MLKEESVSPCPIYRPKRLDGLAYEIRYSWTGWASGGRFPEEPPETFFGRLRDALERDHIRLLNRDWNARQVQCTASVTPRISPAHFASRMKGRLQHALRQAGHHARFRRSFAVRSVGHVRRELVERYIADQVRRASLADPEYEAMLEDFTTSSQNARLSEPSASNSGRYWYNLHLVLTTDHRHRLRRRERFETIHERCHAIAESKGHVLSALSVMPDHLHVALRGHYEESPQEIGLSYMNNLAYAMGQRRFWQNSFYVGTFGEYDMGAIR